MGRDGRIGYEVYSYVGVNFTLGNGPTGPLRTAGWMAGSGVRTLFFDPTQYLLRGRSILGGKATRTTAGRA